MRVDELFEDANGEMMFSGQYFYQPQETVLGHCLPPKEDKGKKGKKDKGKDKGQGKGKEGKKDKGKGKVDKGQDDGPMIKKVHVPQLKGRLFLAADEDNRTYVTVHTLKVTHGFN